jgi:predicted RNA binding protein YcfA (HicA-like mRNA interferase family)
MRRPDEFIKANPGAREDGWKLVRITGSHHHFKHPERKGLVTVPHPKKDLPIGPAKSILKTAGLV